MVKISSFSLKGRAHILVPSCNDYNIDGLFNIVEVGIKDILHAISLPYLHIKSIPRSNEY